VFDLSAYIPDALLPQYESIRDGVLAWLRTFGVVKDSVGGGGAAGKLSGPPIFFVSIY
jgi:protein kinase C substrate 80K-H